MKEGHLSNRLLESTQPCLDICSNLNTESKVSRKHVQGRDGGIETVERETVVRDL